MKNTNTVAKPIFATILPVNPNGPSTHPLRSLYGSVGLSALLLMVGACASHPKPIALSPSTNPETALSELERDLASAEAEQQLSVFANKDYKGVQKHLREAQNDIKDDDRDDALKNIGIARAYLSNAATYASATSKHLSEIMAARKLAVDASAARFYADDLKNIDEDLIDETEDGAAKAAKIDTEDKTKLQQRYLDLELAAIKSVSLNDAKSYIEGAKKIGAEKISPQSLKSAEEKYQAAELTIASDRHNRSIVEAASKSALDAATQLAVVTQTAVDSRNRSPEQIAIELEQRRASNANLQGKVQAYSSEISTYDRKNKDLSQKSAALSSELSTVKAQEAAIAKAEQSFDKDEAEVYRQGDQLLIRLKALNFKSGSSSLPSASVNLLGKVREVVAEFNPSQIKIEGHTDSTGTATKNMQLSKERAEAVAKYMVSTNVIAENEIMTEGFGPEKPLQPNSSKAGRATNRRVDLILVPSVPSSGTGAL